MTTTTVAGATRRVAAPALSLCRRKLLDAIRGGGIPRAKEDELVPSDPTRRPLKCFRLQKHHIGSFLAHTKKDHHHHHLPQSQPPPLPVDFHATLCDCIRHAKRRVTLASLYIGPAADPIASPAELQLLQALQHAASNNTVQVTILLDHNRALRPVALPPPTKTQTTTTTSTTAETKFITSAQLCFQALHGGSGGASHHNDKIKSSSNSNNKIYLFSVLPDFWQAILGKLSKHHHPVSEAAGVFHIKLYIIDDQLFLSGANLSQEYFSNRHDRYLYIQNGGNGLVDCYAQLVDVLCQYAQEYHHDDDDDGSVSSGQERQQRQGRRRIGAQELMHLVSQVLTTSEKDDNDYQDLNEDYSDIDHDNENRTTWAYAVPTFQAPLHFQQERFMQTDVETIRNWIQSAAAATSAVPDEESNNPNSATTTASVSLRIASAYLNPTKSFREMLQRCCRTNSNLDMVVHYLTAGRVSHGFTTKRNKPAPTSGSSKIGATTTTIPPPQPARADHPRRDWIPTLFDATARQVLSSNESDSEKEKKKKNIHLWFYQRPNWTFHAKGIWLCSGTNNSNENSDSRRCLEIDHEGGRQEVLYGCTHGSGNYGARSEYRDLESNLILTFPPRSPLAKQHVDEWNSMCTAAVPSTQEPKQQMSWPLRLIFPWIKSFF